MKRPIIILLISYIIGILGGLYLKGIIFFFLIFSLSCFFICIKNINKKYFRFLRKFFRRYTAILIICSISLGYYYTNELENKYNNLYKEAEEIKEYALVVSEKQESKYKDTYKIKIVNSRNKKRNNTHLYMRVKKGSNINYGDMIFINAKFLEPEIDRNERGFNYKEYLKTINIYGTLETNKYTIIEREKINKILLYTSKLKKKLKDNICKVIEKEENEKLIIAMILGDTDELSDDIKEDFLNSNLYHILSVSGGQVSNIIIGITIISKILKAHKRILNISCIIILIQFMFLTGLTPSIIRACIMCIISLIASLSFKRYDIANSLGISLLIILLNNPHSINSLSVLLSYFGFLGIIILGSPCIKKINEIIGNNIIRYILNIIISSISAQIFIFPIILYIFGTISLTFMFSNLFIIPLSSIITIIGFFIMICPLKIFGLVEPIIEITINIVKFFANMNISKIYCIIPSIIQTIIYYVINIYLYYMIRRDYIYKIKHFIKKYGKAIVIIITIITVLRILSTNNLENCYIDFIDVGQGDATLIVTNTNKKILIDGGGSEFNSDFDVGKNTLLPHLLKKKINKLDYVIISHFDSDHVGGILTILNELKVEKVIIGKQFETSQNYEEFIKIMEKKKIKLYVVETGQKIKVDKDTTMDILWPDTSNIIKENILNNNSLVCKLNFKDKSMLCTGDIEEIAEKAILSKYSDNLNILNADIIKIAHHGSKTSSITPFINKVRPKIALIGVGKNNKFGHPNFKTIENLEKMGVKIFRTDENGEIQIKITNRSEIITKVHLKSR